MFVRTRLLAATLVALSSSLGAQSAAVEFRDPRQRMDEDFAKSYLEWTRETKYGSPLVSITEDQNAYILFKCGCQSPGNDR